MDDQDGTAPQHQPRSGSRWEPNDATTEDTFAQPAEPAGTTGEWSARTGSRGAQADAAAADTVTESPRRPWAKPVATGVGLLVLGGLGGYAVGHATSGGDQLAPTSFQPGQQGQQGPDGDGEGRGFGHGPGGFGGPGGSSGSDGQMTPPQNGSGEGGTGQGGTGQGGTGENSTGGSTGDSTT